MWSFQSYKEILRRNYKLNSDIAIEVRNIKKKFKVYFDKGYGLKEKILFAGRSKYEERWVLNGVSFKIKKGQAVGLIGKNGCGKSTMLKLINRIIYPTEGTVQINGRVSSLLELGAGFHPDMSGRENIYTNASIFGLTKKEIDKRLNDIIKFSELEEFIDCPVRTYSSGMYMRLAFSVAINVDADILLIDEILAVGDVSFQAKCFERLKEIKDAGTTIVLVSHSPTQIEQICDRAIWIENGKIREDGLPRFVGESYLAQMEGRRLEKLSAEKNNESKVAVQTKDIEEYLDPNWCQSAIRSGNKKIRFTKVELLNEKREQQNTFSTGDNIIVHMEYESEEEGTPGNFGVGISRDDGVYCYGTNNIIENGKMISTKKQGSVDMMFVSNALLPAKYILDVAVHTKDEIPFDKIHHILEFHVISRKKDFGVCRMKNKWFVDNEELIEKG